MVRAGDVVEQGQVVAQLDDRELLLAKVGSIRTEARCEQQGIHLFFCSIRPDHAVRGDAGEHFPARQSPGPDRVAVLAAVEHRGALIVQPACLLQACPLHPEMEIQPEEALWDEADRLPGGQRVTVQKKVYPGYVLVEMILDPDSWFVVRNTPGVTSFVGGGNIPLSTAPVPSSV